MKKSAIAILLTLVLFSAAAYGHGNEKHILGTVTEINADSMKVRTRQGRTVSVRIVQATKFTSQGAEAKATDLKPGDRVVVHARPKPDGLEAHEVRFVKK